MPRRACSRRKLTTICVVPEHNNVPPLAVLAQKAFQQEMAKLLKPDFIDLNTALSSIRKAALPNNEEDRCVIVIDASSVPRHLIVDVLKVAENRSQPFKDVFFCYSYPKEYLPGDLEIASPKVEFEGLDDVKQPSGRMAAVLFPGFNPAESAVLLSTLIAWKSPDTQFSVRWLFNHPSAQRHFYERAICSHRPFFESGIWGADHQVRSIYSLANWSEFISQVAQSARDVGQTGRIFIGGGGPRVLVAPAFLSCRLLKSMGYRCAVALTRPLAYTTMGSSGEVRETAVWDVGHEYENARKVLQQICGEPKQSALFRA